MIISNIVISSPKVVNKSDKITNHPVLNPNYILYKKDSNEEKNNILINKYPENKYNFYGNKENKRLQENKKLKEKIKEKAKNTELLLNDNKISYENEKIMKKIDEFDARLFKNINHKPNFDKIHRKKEIKISFVDKEEKDDNINKYCSNDLNYVFNNLKLKDGNKDFQSRVVEKPEAQNKNLNQLKISTEFPENNKNKIQSNKNKNIKQNRIDPEMMDNLFPYSKEILSNKNGSEAKKFYKNGFCINNNKGSHINNNNEESSEKLKFSKEKFDEKNAAYSKIKIQDKDSIKDFNNSLESNKKLVNFDIKKK